MIFFLISLSFTLTTHCKTLKWPKNDSEHFPCHIFRLLPIQYCQIPRIFSIHFIHFQAELSILDAVILELTGCKNDKIAIQQLEKVQNATGKLLEKVQKV